MKAHLRCTSCGHSFGRHKQEFPYKGKSSICDGFLHPTMLHITPVTAKCVRCGIEYGDHQAKEPHANTYGNPRCAGFSLEKRKNYILSDHERMILNDDPQAVRNAIIELLGEDPLTDGGL